ncbi:hypothetical protein KVR01_005922 [Diaporthe batatas]|uniref:uncharacterized protein n=1 Tax=Diaporthe batatas TaxID=748121 RepID=UPI001D04FD7A|nr:uncharacterized protein KVR01_005922 [Diaporthe batatas]KAG8164004.1 hypothetical protein KVR01_005922 [Diaporthe batatas]
MAYNHGGKDNKSLPAMLKCAADGKLEKSDMFSNNMLKKRQFNPSARITCRKHTAGPTTELLCSNCRKHKPVIFFSNAERKSSGSQRCRACIEWMENDAPGHVPLPAPNSVREEDELKPFADQNTLNLAFVDSDDDDDFVTEAHDDGVSGTWMGRSKESSTAAKSGAGLTASNLQSLDDFGNSRSASSRGVGSYHASSAPTDTASTAGTDVTTRPSGGPQFNAYGPEGQFQKRQAGTAASVVSGTSRTSRSSSGRNAWIKVPGRKTGPSLPRHLEYENPEFVGQEDYDDDDSSDGC